MKKTDRDLTLSQLAAILGRRGAASTNAKLTPRQRKARARRAVRERWRRYYRERQRKEALG